MPEASFYYAINSLFFTDSPDVAESYSDYAFTHSLLSDKMTIYSDSKVSRFLNSITKNQCIGFLDDWNKNRVHKSRIYISYDSTNKNSQAGDVDLVSGIINRVILTLLSVIDIILLRKNATIRIFP